MGVYRAAIVTENGQNLIAQALANEKPLIFTSAKTSSYSYPVGTDVPALTGLQDVVQSVLPFDSKVLGGNVAQVSVRFDNDGVDQTYRIETIGLYAKIEGGAETLFSVTQATTPDEMPVQSDISPSAYIYNIQHTVQNASQITLTVNPAGTATVQDIMDIETPEFDDSGTVEGISSFPSFLETMKSKMNFFQFFRNLKAGLQFVLHAGQIVNNCVTDNAGLPLSAAQGKALMDKYTQLYSDLKMSQHTISMVTAYDSFATIVRQRCYIDNKSLIINVLIDIKNKDAFDEYNNILIFLNMHTEKQVIDIAGVVVGANRSIFMYAKDNAIYLNTRPEANGYYVLNCTIPFISL